MNRKADKISDQLRRAILAADVTQYRIAKELGIHQATLTRFMHGERGLTLEVVDALGQFLGLKLTTDEAADRPAPPPTEDTEARGARSPRRTVRRTGDQVPSKKGRK